MEKQECCEKVVVAYDQGRIYCASCDKTLSAIVDPSQIMQIKAGYSRTVCWDRQIWSFPVTFHASLQCTTWAQIRQSHLELFEEARKEVNNTIRTVKHEFIDPHRRPEEIA